MQFPGYLNAGPYEVAGYRWVVLVRHSHNTCSADEAYFTGPRGATDGRIELYQGMPLRVLSICEC